MTEPMHPPERSPAGLPGDPASSLVAEQPQPRLICCAPSWARWPPTAPDAG
jgi:hypothetical protein